MNAIRGRYCHPNVSVMDFFVFRNRLEVGLKFGHVKFWPGLEAALGLLIVRTSTFSSK